MSIAQKCQIERKREGNYLYYMCLMDWGGAIIPPQEHIQIALAIIPQGEERYGWRVMSGEDNRLEAAGVMSRFSCGYYHSRLIFQFELADAPRTMAKAREIRQKVEEFTESYIKDGVFPEVLRVSPGRGAKAFIYAVFELNDSCELWKFARTSPYSLPTTCFYTGLLDPGSATRFLRWVPWLGSWTKPLLPSKVQIRISGAKIITSHMSDWFFWNLTNIIYHEGLYRQSREIHLGPGDVSKGLEERLENFADELMASFSQSIANEVQTSHGRLLVFLTLSLVLFTIALIILTVVLIFSGGGATTPAP